MEFQLNTYLCLRQFNSFKFRQEQPNALILFVLIFNTQVVNPFYIVIKWTALNLDKNRPQFSCVQWISFVFYMALIKAPHLAEAQCDCRFVPCNCRCVRHICKENSRFELIVVIRPESDTERTYLGALCGWTRKFVYADRDDDCFISLKLYMYIYKLYIMN